MARLHCVEKEGSGRELGGEAVLQLVLGLFEGRSEVLGDDQDLAANFGLIAIEGCVQK